MEKILDMAAMLMIKPLMLTFTYTNICPAWYFANKKMGKKAMQLAETDGVILAAIIHYKTSSHYHFLLYVS